MPTTADGLPYPDDSDYVINGADAIAALAIAVQAALDLFLRLDNGGSFQDVQDVVQFLGGVYAEGDTSSAVTARANGGADAFAATDASNNTTVAIGPTGRLKFVQAGANGHLGTAVGAAGAAAALVQPAKYLKVTVDGVDYKLALFNS